MLGIGNVNDQQFLAVVLGAGESFCESVNFDSIEVIGAVLSPAHSEQIRVKIDQLNAGKNSSSNSSNNPVTPTTTTNIGIPTNTSGNNPLAHFETDGKTLTNPMATKTSSGSGAVDSFTKGYQQGQQIGEAATAIVDLFTPSPAQIQAKRAEFERQKKLSDDIEGEEKEKRFGKLYYYPLIDKANNGDEEARMILYFASYNLWSTQFVPKRNEWRDQAYKNKNFDAILSLVMPTVTLGKSPVPLFQEAADLGSVDGLVELGEWFDRKSYWYLGFTSEEGGNPEKALEAFTEAAEKGSPNAMYYLGMIYKYGSTKGKNINKKTDVIYSIQADEKKAFEWFSKSLKPDYIPSWYAKSESYRRGSYFTSASYLELAEMYRKGKVVTKDKDKAKAYEKLHEEYTSYKNF